MRLQNRISRLVLFLFTLIMMIACGDRRWTEKIRELEQIEDPGSYRLRMEYMNYIFRNTADEDQALEYCKKLIESSFFTEARYGLDHLLGYHGEDAQMYYLKAVCFRNQLRFDSARVYIDRSLDMNPDNAVYRKELQNILDEQDLWKEVERVDSRISTEGFTTGLLVRRAGLLTRAGHPEAALLDINKAYEKSPEDKEVLRQAGFTHLFMTRFDSSLMYFQRAREVSNETELGEIIGEVERIRDASEKISESPAEAGNYITVARSLSSLGFYDPAVKFLDRGLNAGGDQYRLLYGKLLLHLEWRDMDSARQVYIAMKSEGYELDEEIERLFME